MRRPSPDRLGRESRWPPAAAALVVVALPILVPQDLTLGPQWLLPTVGFMLGTGVVTVDLLGGGRRARVVRAFGVGLTVIFIISSAWMTTRLLDVLIHGGPATDSAAILLTTGGLVWFNNNIVFGFLYWQLDAGGPVSRHQADTVKNRGFAFPQHTSPMIAQPGWAPAFVDYLYLGLTNALAFSPTDAMPVRPWAKLTMALQSLLSIAILSLVIARAVNVMS